MMKNRFSVVGLSSFVGLAISLLAGLSLFNKKNSVEPVSAAINYSACETAHSSGDAEELKTALYNVVKNGSAGSYGDLWTDYWTVYKRDDGYLKDYYSSISNFTTANKDNGSGGTTEGDKYNREHAIPKSWWGGDTTNQGADIFIVVPADKKVNNTRSDNCFGMVGSASYTSSGGYSKLGTSANGWDFFGSPVFEPNDDVKGDLARIYFYAVIKYNVSSWRTGNGSYVFNGNTSVSSNFGLTANAVKLLSYWNNLDKPDAWEKKVNTRGNSVQGNPNPFIDHPEYANTLWGTVSGYTSYSDSDASITLSSSSESISAGDTLNLTATTSGGSGDVTWSSSNESVATVTSSGVITGVAAGNAIITARYSGASDTCLVTVTSSSGGGGGQSETDTETGSVTAVSSALSGWTLSGTGSYADGSVKFDSGGDNAYKVNIFSGDVSNNMTSLVVTINGMINGTPTSSNSYKVEALGSSGNVLASDVQTGASVVGTSYGDTVFTISSNLTGCTGIKVTYVTKGAGNWGIKSISWVATYTTGQSSDDPSLSFDLTEISGYTGQSISITATYSNLESDLAWSASGTGSITGGSIIWSSNDHRNGTSTFVCTLSAAGGKTIVADADGVEAAQCVVSITKTAFSALPASTASVFQGQSTTLTAALNSSGTIDWSSNNTNIATVSESGNSVTVSGVAAGSATITARSEDDSSVYAECEVTVSAVTLTSITISGYTTSFTVGDTFSFGGTVTAHYDNDSTSDVTASATFSGYNMSTAGTQTVTVCYGGESETYQITVSEQSSATDSTQFSLINSTSDLEAGKSYIITNGVSGTVRAAATTSSANNRRSVSATISNGKITRGSSIMSFTLGGSTDSWTFATENYGGTAGYLASNGNNNYLQVNTTSAGTATIEFNGDAATINIGPSTSKTLVCFNSGIDSPNGGFSCYSSQGQYGLVYLWKEVSNKTLSSITLDTSNVQTTFSVGDTFNYTGLVVTAHYSDSSSKTVTPTSVSTPSTSTTGNKTVTVSYTESGTTKTADYSITVNSNPSISWTAPTISKYTGSTLSGSDVNGWAVTYNDGAGHQTVLTYSQLTVKLGGTTISIPHTWVAADNGKTLTAAYNSLTTAESSAVEIIQTVNSINAPSTSSWDFTFGEKKWSAAGSQTLSGKTWTMSGTDDGSPYFGYDDTKGQQFGSGSHPWSDISLQSSAFSGTIDSVTVYTSGANSINATVQVSVGGTAYGSAQTITNANAAYTFNLGGKSGTISIDYVNSSSKAIYIKEIVVNTVSGSVNIANSEGHMNAQKVAVKFAKAFNDAMDDTANCTTGLSDAWSTCSSAYTTFLSEAAALGSAEETYAKNLIKFATAQYSDDSGEACIERMRKTYEICVSKHGQTAFMSDLVTVSPTNNVVLFSNIASNKNVIVIVIVSLISVTTIGGYFFIRRRKPE